MALTSGRRTVLGLTSVRGFAAIAVLLFHIQVTFPTAELPLIDCFTHGALGVDLFFVLSGYILAHAYQSARPEIAPVKFLLRFIKARLARVYPLHLATLMTTAVLVWAVPGFFERSPRQFTASSFALNLLLLQNWGLSQPSWNLPSWSISAEWFMYLLFPGLLVLWSAHKQNDRAWAGLALGLAAACLALHGGFIAVMGWTDHGGMALGGMVRVFFEFLVGFFVFQARPLSARPTGVKGALFDTAVVSVVVFAVVLPSGWVLFVPAVAVLIWDLGWDAGLLARAMRFPPLVYLGNISFSLYMWHWLIIQIHNLLRERGLVNVDTRDRLLLHCASMLICSFVVAALSYRWLELPMRVALGRVSHTASPILFDPQRSR